MTSGPISELYIEASAQVKDVRETLEVIRVLDRRGQALKQPKVHFGCDFRPLNPSSLCLRQSQVQRERRSVKPRPTLSPGRLPTQTSLNRMGFATRCTLAWNLI